MAGQEQRRRHHERDDDQPEPGPAPAADQARSVERDDDLDALLDEIDGVLETDAQEFVHTFVQKGGQ
jgi:prokaryotic ubiquitin-like protein Pup